MKKTLIGLISLLIIILQSFAQSAGDYRSTGNGNWNDATKWQKFDGTNWVSTTTYPGQNAGTGNVSILAFHEIRLTASVPHPIAELLIDLSMDEWNYELFYGFLVLSAENAVSLTVRGTVNIYGVMQVDDQPASKSHMLFIGGSLNGTFNAINGDDNISVIFNSTVPNSTIYGGVFRDVTLNGNIFTVVAHMAIYGKVTFVNGIVNASPEDPANPPDYGIIHFKKGASWSGGSNNSYVDGWVGKEGDEPFTFPIGENGIYAPLTISAPVGQTQLFFAKYKRASGSDLGGITDTGLFNISQCEYWNLMPGNGEYTKNYPLSITVGWNSSSGCGSSPYITNVSDVTLAHHNSFSWNSHGGTATGTAENGSVTWSGVTTFSPFTLGNIGTCKTPSGLSATNTTGNSATLSWSPEPGAVSYDVYYANFPSAPVSYWNNIATGTTSTSVNVSGLTQSTQYYYRVHANCASGSSSYRQSGFTTLTVCDRPTGLITTNITNVSAIFNWSPVAGAISYHVEYEHFSEWTPVNEIITSTSYTQTGLLPGDYYRWRVRANCPLGFSHYEYSQLFNTYYTFCNETYAYEPNDVPGQAKAINLGTSISAAISSNTDVDWFKVTTPNGPNTTLQVTLSNLSADYDLFIYDRNLNPVGSSESVGNGNEIVVVNSKQRKAVYFVKVLAKLGAYDLSQCYNLLAQAGGGSGNPIVMASGPARETGQSIMKDLLYPNPASEFVYMNFNSIEEGIFKIQILNNVGQLVKLYTANAINGHNNIRIPVGEISPGMYILKAMRGELILQRKFVIAR